MRRTHGVSRRTYLEGAVALLGSGLLGALFTGSVGAQAGATEIAQDMGDGTAQNWLVYPDGSRVPSGTRYAMATGEAVTTPTQLLNEPVTLRIMAAGNPTNQRFLNEITKLITTQAPNVKVEHDTSGGQVNVKLLIAHVADSLPDLTECPVSQGRMATLAFNNVFRPIDDLVRADTYDLGQFYAEAVNMVRFDGKLQGLPNWSDTQGVFLFYNKNLFDSAGMKYPDQTWTLDTLIAAAGRLTKRSGDTVEQWGYRSDFFDYMPTVTLMRRWGSDFMNEEGTKILIDTPESIAAVQWLYDLFHVHRVSPPREFFARNPDFPTEFRSGKYPLAVGHTWQFDVQKILEQNNVRMGITLMPPGPTGKYTGVFTTGMWAMTRQVRNVPWGWWALQVLASKESGILGKEINTFPGARPDIDTDPRITGGPQGDMWRAISELIYPVSPPQRLPKNLRTAEIHDLYNSQLEPMMVGQQLAPRSALQSLAKALQGIVDRPR